jgi:hypothetical protein
VLVVLAGREDLPARRLVAGWPGTARVLTCRDLCRPGWRYRPGRRDGTAVIDGESVEVAEVEGVLTRLPAAMPWELREIDGKDRHYVASEMNACLVAWLSELECPVLNRPAPWSLMGPPWTPERWTLEARRLGIPVVEVRSVVADLPATALPVAESPAPESGRDITSVTVVGRRVIGDTTGIRGDAALRLAGAAGVQLLRVHFVADEGQRPRFAAADFWLDLDDARVAAALPVCLEEAGSP